MRPDQDQQPDATPPARAKPASSKDAPAAAKPAPAKRPAAARPASAAKRLEALQTQLDAASEAERAALRRADELAVVARKQAEMADELHAENVRLREGEVREAVAPIIRGLARLSDDMARLRLAASEPGAAFGLADLRHLEGRVLELLGDAGVVPLTPAPGDPFDVRLHEAAGSIATEDPLEDRTIVAVRRPGLIRDDGRILRAAAVLVHRFDLTPGDQP